MSQSFSVSTSLSNTTLTTVGSVTLHTGAEVTIRSVWTVSSNSTSGGQQVSVGVGVNSTSSFTSGAQLVPLISSSTLGSTVIEYCPRVLHITGLTPGSNTFNFLASNGSTPSVATGVACEGEVEYAYGP